MKEIALTLVLMFLVLSMAQGEKMEQFNGTVYYLSKSEAEVLQSANGTNFNITLPVKSEIRLFDSHGKEVPINSTVNFWRGSYKYKIVSEKAINGHLNYTQPIHDQRFAALVRSKGSVRVVLPPGYTTGGYLLGRPRPSPNEIREEDGRMVLTWERPKSKMIEVSYYKKEAPRAFLLFLLLLVFLGGILSLEYLMSMRRLKLIRERADQEAK
ncbi:MAG: DUF5803 family protein [Methanotrichaceae archaeon]